MSDVRTTRYEPPRIEDRTAIDDPLVQTASPGVDGFSASFRPL
jgi:hypothetical protein